MDIIDANAIVKTLFNTDSTTLVEVLTVFMLHFVFYSLITLIIILLLHLIAKVLNKSMQLRKGFHGFIRRFWDSVLIQSLLISLFLISITYNALFEFLVFMVMWLQLEIAYVSWRIEAGPHFVFDVSRCEDIEPSTEVCVETGNIYIHVRNVGRIPVHSMRLTRVLDNKMMSIKPEVWEKHIEHPIISLAPGEVKYVISMDQDILPNYLNKVFEICYSTPLQPHPLEECIYITLANIGTKIAVYQLDPSIIFNTPLIKLYRMWRDVAALPHIALMLRRASKIKGYQ
uniref:Uncharacterized protein n=1 Tax=Ignisphaera aggregans TaxID=334771 RepID=A0A7J2U0D3_9CREN